MRTFHLDRREDPTGVSGTGKVAEGVEFSDGRCVVRWLTEVASVVFYDRIEDVDAIHGHHGATGIVFREEDRG